MFCIYTIQFKYYIFDSHSCGSLGQLRENCYSILLQFVTTEHALDFIATTNLVNNQLQHVCENQFFFLNLKCVVCNRCHCDSNVTIFKREKYSHNSITKINTNVSSFDHKFYIFKTCNASSKIENVWSSQLPSGLQLENVPETVFS